MARHPFGTPCICGHTRDEHYIDGSKCTEPNCPCEVFIEEE